MSCFLTTTLLAHLFYPQLQLQPLPQPPPTPILLSCNIAASVDFQTLIGSHFAIRRRHVQYSCGPAFCSVCYFAYYSSCSDQYAHSHIFVTFPLLRVSGEDLHVHNGGLSTLNPRLLHIRLYCGNEAMTNLCAHFGLDYACTNQGITKKKSDHDCDLWCHCYDEKGNPFKAPPHVPPLTQPWDPNLVPTRRNDDESSQHGDTDDAGKGQILHSRGFTETAVSERTDMMPRDEKFLKLHIDCHDELRTHICTSIVYEYYCSVKGLDHRPTGAEYEDCEAFCQCYDEKNRPYRQPWGPGVINPWSPVGSGVDEATDDSSRDQSLQGRDLTATTIPSELIVVDRQVQQFMKVHLNCGNDLRTRTCTSVGHQYICNSGGLKAGVRSWECDTFCKCYDEDDPYNQIWGPGLGPLSPIARIDGEEEVDT